MNLNLESDVVTKRAQEAANSPSCTANKSNEQQKYAEGIPGLVINIHV